MVCSVTPVKPVVRILVDPPPRKAPVGNSTWNLSWQVTATWKWDYLELGEERINTETNYRPGSFRSFTMFWGWSSRWSPGWFWTRYPPAPQIWGWNSSGKSTRFLSAHLWQTSDHLCICHHNPRLMPLNISVFAMRDFFMSIFNSVDSSGCGAHQESMLDMPSVAGASPTWQQQDQLSSFCMHTTCPKCSLLTWASECCLNELLLFVVCWGGAQAQRD